MRKKLIVLGLVGLALVLIAARAVKSSTRIVTVTIDVSEDDQFANRSISMDGHLLMAIEIPSAWTGADLEVYCSSDRQQNVDSPTTTDFKQLYTEGGTAVEIGTAAVVLSSVMAFTGSQAAAVMACDQVILHSSAAQAADRELKITLKS